MSAFLINLVLDDIFGKLPRTFLDFWSKEFRRSDGHDGNGKLRFSQFLVDVAVLQACSVRLQDSAKAAWLLHTLDPVVESLGLNLGWIVAFLLDEHFPEFPLVALDEHFRNVWNVEETEVLCACQSSDAKK